MKPEDKIQRLRECYDLSDPFDLFTILPQEMEIVEAKAQVYKWSSDRKKEEVIKVLSSIAQESNLELDTNLISNFIDTIIKASRNEYGLNKHIFNKDGD